uniref:C2H2-type domain-containing protein n=1 Tax=Caenorhabditis tropicalis TaxID=1561998 RepID=A0A1I7TS26_9PELO
MAAIIGGGPRKPPRIMRKNIVLKPVRKSVRDDEGVKIKREGYQVQSGVLTVNHNHPSNFKPKVLPGLANDIESFPCRFCDDKIFLTSKGLLRHATECHPQNLDEIETDINTISAEWKKREFERARTRERQSMEKLRHEARAHQLMKAMLSGNNPPTSTVDGEHYEACTICNMLVNIAHPTAMESHQRAHKKNDELRLQLIDQHGPEAVQRLTCDACSLVFPDLEKLHCHIASHHTRRKKFICKFCGHISLSMSELNLHKNDVHNYSAWTNVPEYLKSRRTFYQYDEVQKRLRRRTNTEINEEASRQPILGEISDGDTAGRITCPECNLKLNRPRLLFKHMERVHMKTSFTCMVETGGLPTFEIEVLNGDIFWTCCDTKFDNRPEFIEHRRLHIPSHHEEVIVDNSVDLNDIPSTSQTIVAAHEENVNDEGDQQAYVQMFQDEQGNVHQFYVSGNYDPTTILVDEHGGRLFPVQPDGNGHVDHILPEYMENHDGQEDDRMIIGEDDMLEIGELDDEGNVEENEYDQYQMDLGNEWTNMDNMEMILVNGDDVLEEEQSDVDNHHIDHHQMMGNDESEEGVVEINGQPLFD